MMRFIDHAAMGRGRHGWLDSYFHFSFAEYYNPDNINFGVLRVMNDDIVQRGTGFDPHPHENMEIISYVVSGELTHEDSMGNQRVLTPGQIQYMSAGTGVVHSEYNRGTEPLRFFQIWIFPDKIGRPPAYGDVPLNLEDRYNRWLPLASGRDRGFPVKIHQDAALYASIISPGTSLDAEIAEDRQAYLALIEGTAVLTGKQGSEIRLSARDAAEITGESLRVAAGPGDVPAHLILIEMPLASRAAGGAGV